MSDILDITKRTSKRVSDIAKNAIKTFDLSGGKDYKELQTLREALGANLETEKVWLHESVLEAVGKHDKALADSILRTKKIDEAQAKALLEKAKAQQAQASNSNQTPAVRSYKACFVITLIVAVLLLIALILVLIFK